MAGGSAGPRGGAGSAALVIAFALALGCATGLRSADGLLRDGKRGWEIADPTRDGDFWRRVSVRGVDLSFRGADGTTMSFFQRCKRPVTRPDVMARQLTIGLEEQRVRAASPLSHQGYPGWSQVLDARLEGRPAQLKTVTLVARGCSFDWILTGRDGFGEAEPRFDAWWSSFRFLEPEPAPGGPSG